MDIWFLVTGLILNIIGVIFILISTKPYKGISYAEVEKGTQLENLSSIPEKKYIRPTVFSAFQSRFGLGCILLGLVAQVIGTLLN